MSCLLKAGRQVMNTPFLRIRNVVKYRLADCHLLQFDGGAVPNPGKCGSGAVLFSPEGLCLRERGVYIPYGTNNIAEYTGLRTGLEMALEEGVKAVRIEGDSNLVIQQITGNWAVKNAELKNIFADCVRLLNQFEYVVCRHVYREYNTHADRLTNEIVAGCAGFDRMITKPSHREQAE